jgi:hypothetical protein
MFDQDENRVVWTGVCWFAAIAAYMAGVTYLLVSVF